MMLISFKLVFLIGCLPAVRCISVSTDVDECQNENGGCQHICVKTAGSFKCSCNDGYVLNAEDRASCQKEMAECPMFCGYNSEPVCGSNGKTYDNECLFESAKKCENFALLTVVNKGPCAAKPNSNCPKLCPNLWKPVCGDDGKTYSNKCQFNMTVHCSNTNVKLDYEGKCKERHPKCYAKQNQQNKTKDGPQCIAAIPGFTFDVSIMKCKAFIYGGCGNDNFFNTIEDCEQSCEKAKPNSKCPERCPNLLEPVCGEDGKTYDNMCQFNMERHCWNKTVNFRHEGKCKGETKCPVRCSNTLEPLCASDGKTYDNLCQFNMEVHCLNNTIAWKHEGRCKEEAECPMFCGYNYEQVCGSNGKTYDNDCLFQSAKKCENLGQLTVANKGPCADIPPPPPYENDFPIDGSPPPLEFGNKTVKVSGLIKIPTNPSLPKKMESPSCLEVKLEDISLMDVSSNVLATERINLSGKPPSAIRYTLTSKLPVNAESLTLTVSAVINIGWCKYGKGKNSDEWIRKGDYHGTRRLELDDVNDDERQSFGEHDIGVDCNNCDIVDPIIERDEDGFPDASPPPIQLSNRTIEIVGNISFPTSQSSVTAMSFESPSCVEVKLEDVSIMDVSSNVLAVQKIQLSGKNSGAVNYTLTSGRPVDKVLPSLKLVLSAVVNIGWCKSEDSDEWIRNGDFHGTRPVEINSNTENNLYHNIDVLCNECDSDISPDTDKPKIDVNMSS